MIEYENLYKANVKFHDEYLNTFTSFLDKGWYVLGDQVSQFEENYSKYLGVNHCAGVASGLDALSLALQALEIKKGSEVIVPSNTYIATILSILNNGLKPVLVEPCIDTYNIDPFKIEKAITSKTKAIIVVHLYGKSCEMDHIMKLTKDHNLHLLEDVAQAQGASYKNQKTGTFGIGCHSFYPTKNLGALGDAGGVTSQDKEFIDKIKSLRNYGSSQKYHNEYLGVNSRLDELQACFLNIKLKRLDEINEHKRALAKIYNDNLSNDYIKPFIDDNFYDVYHIYNIRHTDRDLIRKKLLKEGIKTEIHYPIPPHKQKSLKGIFKGKFPISETIHETTLSLPISYAHTEKDIIKIVEVLNSIFSK